ncbi:hypothetical protein Tco_1033589 [Tanacetum coccineum]
MRADELHKFNDGTLNDAQTVLHDIAKGIRMEYLPKRKWSGLHKRRVRVMVSGINNAAIRRKLKVDLEKIRWWKEYENTFKAATYWVQRIGPIGYGVLGYSGTVYCTSSVWRIELHGYGVLAEIDFLKLFIYAPKCMPFSITSKFSDGTLNDVRTALHDIALRIRTEYLPKRKWSGLDKQRARVMIQDIKKQLFQRRLCGIWKSSLVEKNTRMTSGCCRTI